MMKRFMSDRSRLWACVVDPGEKILALLLECLAADQGITIHCPIHRQYAVEVVDLVL